MPSLTVALTSLAILVACAWVRSEIQWRARTRGRPLPPGPKPLPIIGNVLDLPQKDPWIGYRELSAKYGEIMHFRVLGQDLIILGNEKISIELYEKRSANYSDRSKSGMEFLVGWEWNFGFMPYGGWWRRHRRLFWQFFNSNMMVNYQPAQRAEAHRFLRRLLADPKNLQDHVRLTFGAMLLRLVYAIEVSDIHDENLKIVDRALEAMGQGLQPGKWLVEYVPLLKYVPAWFPGAAFQKKFAEWRKATAAMREVPFGQAKNIIAKSTVPPLSLVNTLLTKVEGEDNAEPDAEQIIKHVSGTVFAGGADTTFSTVQSFFLAMSLFPEVQKKAQAELDRVVGPYRLPTHDDRESLPYISAIVKETLRWQNVAPLGVAHCPVEDDEYNGYFIPAGAVVLPNTWAFLHDPEMYPNPDDFYPDRFLLPNGETNPNVRDPFLMAFGFGRRICPGRHLADQSLFITAALVLQVFNITPPLDDDGKPIHIDPRQTNGLLSYPEDCRCTIKVRSAQAEALIRGELLD